MNTNELRENMALLVRTYVSNASAQQRFLETVEAIDERRGCRPEEIKRFLAALDPWVKSTITPEHGQLIKNVYFHFC